MRVRFEDYTWPMMNKNHRPFSHQKECTMFMIRNKAAYNFSDLGTGKTLSALWATDFLLINDKITKILVVTPLSTMQPVWGREIFSNFPHLRYAIAHGPKAKRVQAIKSNVEYVIINHDGVTIMEDELKRAKFDVIIIDELTAFKKATTKRSKSMQRICRTAKAVWGMTGDPTPNSPVEAFGQAKVVNPNNPYLPKYFTKFRSLVETQHGPFLWLPTADADKVVHKILQPAIRFNRDDCIDIPPCQVIDTIVEFSEEQKTVYREMKDDLLHQYDSGEITAANAAVKMMKLLQIAAGSVKNDEGEDLVLDSKPRDDELWRVFEETGHTKLVVFSAFRASIRHIVDLFTKRGVKVDYIDGGVPHKRRSGIIHRFQEGDLQVIVLQPASTAHGITLTAANVIVWYSLVASGEIYKQANGRITRAGQTRKQLLIRLIGCHAEKHITNILERKDKMSTAILGLFKDL